MEFIYEDETLAATIVEAIQTGDIPTLKRLFSETGGQHNRDAAALDCQHR